MSGIWFFLYILLGLIGILVLTGILWRLLSRRRELPCPAWLGWMVEMDNPFSKIYRAVNIIKHANINPGMTVLDAGCGPGRLTIPVAHKIGPQGKVVAMDIQEGMLRRVREKAQKAHLNNIEFLHAGIGEQKLEHNKFDRILLAAVLGEIPDRKAALQEIFNALKPGGILSISEIIGDPHYQRRDVVVNLATEMGFRKKDIFQDFFAYTVNLEKPA